MQLGGAQVENNSSWHANREYFLPNDKHQQAIPIFCKIFKRKHFY
jgi:hypothetical protein